MNTRNKLCKLINWLTILLVLLVVAVPVLEVAANAAVSGSLTDTQIGLSNSNGTWSATGTTITGSVKGTSFLGSYFSADTTLTITNSRDKEVILSFDYSVHFNEGGESSLAINGTTVCTSSSEGQTITGSSGDITIASGSSFPVKLVAGKRSSDNTATLTMSNVKAKGVVTFGAVNGNGSYTVAPNGTVTNTITTTAVTRTDDCGTTYTLTATPAEGYTFVGWYTDSSTDPVSTDATYPYTNQGKQTIYPKFSLPNATVTFAAAQGSGSYTVNGESAPTSKTEALGTSYTLVATPNSGYTFYCWKDGNGNILSTESTYTLTSTGAATVYPVFVPSDSAMFGVGDKTFYDLNEADAYATSQGGAQINLLSSGTLYSGDYTVSAGNTLLIPYDSAFTCLTKDNVASAGHAGVGLDPGAETTTVTLADGSTIKVNSVTYAYRTLTMADGANITVNGALSVSAQHSSGKAPGYCGSTYGPYGHINMGSGSSITVGSGGYLYAFGYITGSGTVDIQSGGTVYEYFQIQDFRGGTATVSAVTTNAGKQILPFSQYYAQNVEVAMTLHYGASEWVFGSIAMNEEPNPTSVQFIGSSGALFNMGTGGSVIKQYDPATDRLIISTDGDVSLSSMTVSFKLLITYNVNSADYVLPLTNNITININSGTATIAEDVALLPGCVVNVANGATLDIAAGASIFIYDSAEWVGKSYVHSGVDLRIVRYSPTRSYTRKSADLVDAVLNVNGYVSVQDGGALYTTGSGAAIISSEGTGMVEFYGNAGTKTETYQFTQSGTSLTVNTITVNNAWLKNADGSYVYSVDGIGEGEALYFYDNGKWVNGTTVTYDGNGGTTADGAGTAVGEWISNYDIQDQDDYTKKLPYAHKLLNGADFFTRAGYTFTGWNTEADGTGEAYDVGETIDVTAGVTLYAQWEANSYTITWNVDGVTSTTTQTYGATLSLPAAPTKTGYTFAGWYTEANGGTKVDENTVYQTAGDTTYYAQWTENTYTVTFDANGGSGTMTSQTIGQVTASALTANSFTRTGYSFVGWNTAADGTGTSYTNEQSLTLTGNITLYAQWTANSYNATFNANGGAWADGDTTKTVEDVTFGAAIAAPADPTREGYTFAGWSPAVGNMTAEGMTFEAQWEINQYTITFDTNGGSTISSITLDYGAAITAPADPTRTGYTFAGWDKEIPATMPAENLTITAQWTVNSYTVTWVIDGATTTELYAYGAAITAPATPTKTGYTFDGWEGDNIPITMGAADVTVTLTSTWTANVYTITWDVDGTTFAATSQTYGTVLTLPDTNPTKDGYTFMGWYTGQDGTGDEVTAETVYRTADAAVYYAYFVKNYTVEVSTGGVSSGTVATGEVIPGNGYSYTFTFGEGITIDRTYGSTGSTYTNGIYVTIGGKTTDQYTYDDTTNTITIDAEAVTGDIVISVWTKYIAYTITFVDTDGSEIASITQNYGTAITAPADPTKTGYTFAGWDVEIPVTMPAENVTITATWAINQYTITWVDGDGNTLHTVTQDYNTAITYPANPTKTGYSFAGWDKTIAAVPAENVTITATWTVNTYDVTIHYVDENGNTLDTVTESATFGQDYAYTLSLPDGTHLNTSSVSVGGVATTDWTYDADTGKLTINADAITGEIAIRILTAVCTDSSTDADHNCDVCEREDITEHDWTVSYTWGDDGKSCTATRTCNCSASETATAVVSGQQTEAPTCTEMGKTTYTATFTEDWAGDPTKEVTDIPALGHKDDNLDHVCDNNCNVSQGEHEDADLNHACDYGCSEAIGTCEDTDLDHDCDYGCDKAYGEHADTDKDHACDYGCTESIGTCEDTDMDHDCDYGCDKVYGEHADADKDHACDYGCTEPIGTCQDADLDHICDYGCTKYFGTHEDTNSDHKCEYGCTEAIGTCADTDNDGDHLCDYGCGATLSQCADDDKDHNCDECGTATSTHTWGTVTYEWSEDGSTCTAKRVCTYNEEHVETATAIISSEVTKAATCIAKGETTYTATFNVEWAVGDTLTLTDVAVNTENHASAEFTYENMGDYHNATRKCCEEKGTMLAHEYDASTHVCVCGDVEEFTVTWIVDGVENEVTYDFGATINKLADPEKEGYTFAGWDKEIPETMPAEDLVFAAKWEINTYTVTVSVVASGADPVPYTYSVTHGGTLTADAGDWKLDTCYTVRNVEATVDVSYDGTTLTINNVTGDITVTVNAEQYHTVGDVVMENYVAATCTEDGSYDLVAYCSECGVSIKTVHYTIDATGHTEVIDAAVEATCTATGLTEGKHCSDCGEILVAQETVAATGHNYSYLDVHSATCTEDGYFIFGCDDCGQYFDSRYDIEEAEAYLASLSPFITIDVTAKGHTAGETVVENAVDATCTTNGHYDEVVYCTVCGEELSRETVTVAATGHNYNYLDVHSATCTEDGYFIFGCSDCGQYFDSRYDIEEAEAYLASLSPFITIDVTAKGHTAGETVVENAVDATCTTNGHYDEVIYCTVCGEELSRETVTVAATGHSHTAVVTAPTCTKAGYTTYTCACGHSYIADVQEATGHSYTSQVTKEATCTEVGVRTYTCTCGDSYTEEIPVIAHSFGETQYIWSDDSTLCGAVRTCTCGHVETAVANMSSVTVDATCTADGKTTYTATFAADWAETQTAEVVLPAAGHAYGEVAYTWSADYSACTASRVCACGHAETVTATVTSAVTNATCTEAGYTVYTATFAADWAETQTAEVAGDEATGHDYGEAIYVWSADYSTCTAIHTCSCGAFETEAVETTGVVTNVTCTADGYTTYTAAFSADWTQDQTVVVAGDKATGHDYEIAVTAPTCTTAGYTTYTCACGETYVSDYVAAKGHSYESVVTEPTCTEAGYTTYTCACGHSYVSDYVAADGHDYEGVVTAPTCTEAGYTTYTCACGNSYVSDYVAAKGHSYESVVTEPTCTEDGYTTYICACDHSYVSDYVAAKGHSYESVVTAPTCTEAGYTTYTCTCGETYVSDYVAADGHDYKSVVTAPTCTEAGYTTYTCACGHSYVSDYVAAKGHSYESVVTAPTCTEDGYTTYTCACGHSYVGNDVAANGHYDAIDDNDHICDNCDYVCGEHLYVDGKCNCGDVLKFTITWIIDGVETTEVYTYGQIPTAPEAVKAADGTYTYTFMGWDKTINPATEDTTYTAIFAKTGWYTDENGTTYLVEDQMAYFGEWAIIGDAEYYFETSGYIAKDICQIRGVLFVFHKETGVFLSDYTGVYVTNADKTYYVENGIVNRDAGLVRVVENGEAHYYYFCYNADKCNLEGCACDGSAVKNGVHWTEDNNGLLVKWDYTFDENGVIVYDAAYATHAEPHHEVVTYDGVMYYTIDGVKVHYGLFQDAGGKYYYARSSGALVTDRAYYVTDTNGLLPADSYLFGADGAIIMEPTFVTGEDGIYYYCNGVLTYGGLIEINGDYYYVRTNGQLVTGRTYWITKTNGLMEEKAYTFDETGKMVIEEAEEEDTTTGIVNVDGVLYYYKNGSPYYAGLIQIDGNYYYVRTNGQLVVSQTYWITKTNGLMAEKAYTFDSEGRMILG